MKTGVQWFEIYVDDLTRAQDFYHALFDLNFEIVANGDVNLAIIQYYDNSLFCPGALVKHPSRGPSSDGSIVYFTITDITATLAKVKTLGSGFQKGPIDIPGQGQIAFCHDSEGNTIGLFQHLTP